MSNLPASLTERVVPMNAPRPTQEWLGGAILTFLSHYFQPTEADPVFEAQIADWIEDLVEFPQKAIEMAIRHRRRLPTRSRPQIGEMIAIIRKFVRSPVERSAEPAPFGPDSNVVQMDPARAAEIAEEVGGTLSRLFRPPTSGPIATIIRHAAEVFGVGLPEIYATSCRPANVSAARSAAAFVARRHLGASFSGFGRALNGMDHSSVVRAAARAEERIESEPEFAARVEEIERRLSA